MSKETYNVWCPDMGEGESDAHLLVAYDHEEAGRDYVESSYNEEAFDFEMVVMVRNHLGGLFKVSVMPEPSTTFYSRVEEVSDILPTTERPD